MEKLIEFISSDEWMLDRLKDLDSCNLPDAWIGAGFIRNRIWDFFHNIHPPWKLNDIDVVYFDAIQADKSYELEIEAYLKSRYPLENWSVKNQARMHLKHGHKAYKTSEEAIGHWVETATCIACRLEKETQQIEIIAPHGIEDLMEMKLRPNPALKKAQAALYNNRIRSKKWAKRWTRLDIVYMEE